MSRSQSGIRIQGLLTAFAANFVRWAEEWVRPRVEQSSTRFAEVLSSPKRLVRVAANSPGIADRSRGGLQVQFSDLSSFPAVIIRLSGLHPVQLHLPPFASAHFLGP